jgi:hypothetical protein
MSHHHHRKRRFAINSLEQKPPKDRTFRFELHGNPTRTPTIHGDTLRHGVSTPISCRRGVLSLLPVLAVGRQVRARLEAGVVVIGVEVWLTSTDTTTRWASPRSTSRSLPVLGMEWHVSALFPRTCSATTVRSGPSMTGPFAPGSPTPCGVGMASPDVFSWC